MTSLKNQLRTFEIYSFTQGALFVFLGAWVKFALPLLSIKDAGDFSGYLEIYRAYSFALLGFILLSFLGITYAKNRLRARILA
jgi:hypothetical protein